MLLLFKNLKSYIMANIHSLYKNLNMSRLVRFPLSAIGLNPITRNPDKDILSQWAVDLVLDTRNFTASFCLVEVKDGFIYFLLTQYWPNQRTLRRYNFRPEVVFIRDKFMSFRSYAN